ncbi:MAG: helix-turn-helix transcriptional regulator, partial [Clostridia bacterium]|nr:helix-turn-helix transcriptional regulator [Clostridia bacterium]
REFGFVPSYISRIFKRNKGVSPNEFLSRYRIGLARKMLDEDPDMKIKELALNVGFKEPYYFSKTFKRETGLWPTEYVRPAE